MTLDVVTEPHPSIINHCNLSSADSGPQNSPASEVWRGRPWGRHRQRGLDGAGRAIARWQLERTAMTLACRTNQCRGSPTFARFVADGVLAERWGCHRRLSDPDSPV